MTRVRARVVGIPAQQKRAFPVTHWAAQQPLCPALGHGIAVEVAGGFLGGAPLFQYVYQGQVRSRRGKHFGVFYPWEIVACKDGYFHTITMVDSQWDTFMELLGNPEWKDDERLKDRQRLADCFVRLIELSQLCANEGQSQVGQTEARLQLRIARFLLNEVLVESGEFLQEGTPKLL